MKLTNKQRRAIKFARDCRRTGGGINGKTYEQWKAEAYPPTPELNKLKAIADKSQAIGEFLDCFLAEKGMSIGRAHMHDSSCGGWDDDGRRIQGVPNDCGLNSGQFEPCSQSIRQLLAEFFGINEDKCEQERRNILEFLQMEI